MTIRTQRRFYGCWPKRWQPLYDSRPKSPDHRARWADSSRRTGRDAPKGEVYRKKKLASSKPDPQLIFTLDRKIAGTNLARLRNLVTFPDTCIKMIRIQPIVEPASQKGHINDAPFPDLL